MIENTIKKISDVDYTIKTIGDIDRTIEYKDGRVEDYHFKNTVLTLGRKALVKMLTNNIGGSFNFYISKMIFGDGGTQSGVKKYVNAGRNGLFGVTRLSKPVIGIVDPSTPTQAIFTSVIKYDEAVGVTLNEMALQMANGDLYSLTTFPDLTKTDEMQITWNWRLNFV